MLSRLNRVVEYKLSNPIIDFEDIEIIGEKMFTVFYGINELSNSIVLTSEIIKLMYYASEMM